MRHVPPDWWDSPAIKVEYEGKIAIYTILICPKNSRFKRVSG